MKRFYALFLTGIIVLVFSGISLGGETYTYTTNAFNRMEHTEAYSWVIDLSTNGYNSNTESLESFTLEFTDISENTNRDKLYVSVLDPTYEGLVSDPDGIGSYTDNNASGNHFDSDVFDPNDAELLFRLKNIDRTSNDISVTYYSDGSIKYIVNGEDRSHEPNEDNPKLDTYATTSPYNGNVVNAADSYILDNKMVVTFDPDCHHSVGEISLILTTSTIPTTSTVPEPETLVLFGLGLLGVSAFGRKRFGSMG